MYHLSSTPLKLHKLITKSLILTCRFSREVSGPGEKESTASRVGIEPFLKHVFFCTIGGHDGCDLCETGRLKVRWAKSRMFPASRGLKFGWCFLINEVHFKMRASCVNHSMKTWWMCVLQGIFRPLIIHVQLSLTVVRFKCSVSFNRFAFERELKETRESESTRKQ